MKISLLGKVSFTLVVCLLYFGAALAQSEPPNKPAEIQITDKSIMVSYHGKIVLKGKIKSAEPFSHFETLSESTEVINQVIMLQGKDLVVEGEIRGSEESFPCEADRCTSNSYDLVRHSIGLSHSLLNRAVYDRQSDWVLSVDEQGSRVVLVPQEGNRFGVEIKGNEICLRFRPRFYQKHRGLVYFKPWEYRLPKDPVTGWCSWFAFWNHVTENDIHRTADILSQKLVPYGLEYLQIDDGYQREPLGSPETWLVPNQKFPDGMENLAGYIKSKGLIPGIWTNTSFQDEAKAEASKQLFVLDKEGNPAKGNWISYCLDGSNTETIDKMIRPIYHGFAQMGWNYFKVDALRHLRYDGYNSFPDFFKKKGISRDEAFRHVIQAVREEIGPDNYLLACWGPRPELIGLIDACRIGTDGYGLGGLSQYNSFNHVVWLNDPDHIEAFGDYAYRDCMATSLTGSLYMITDKPEDYESGNLEPVIRTIPVLSTLPSQLYDVDPTRSMYLNRVDSETSGSGERVFDAGRTSFNDLFLLEVNKPFGNWMVLGRTGERVNFVESNRLGLDPANEYLVFEFWTKQFRGSFSQGFCPGPIDSVFKCQAFCIRTRKDHPQLMATNRHISCGAQDIEYLEWKNNRLAGESEMVANDDYILYIHEPEGYVFSEIVCPECEVVSLAFHDQLRLIHLKSLQSKPVHWSVLYKTDS